jgi:hypothetical protein
MLSIKQITFFRSSPDGSGSKLLSVGTNPLFTVNAAIFLVLGATLCFLIFFALRSYGIPHDRLGTPNDHGFESSPSCDDNAVPVPAPEAASNSTAEYFSPGRHSRAFTRTANKPGQADAAPPDLQSSKQ